MWKRLMAVMMTVGLLLGCTGSGQKDITGDWKLSQVFGTNQSGERAELKKEENQSFFGEGTTVYRFAKDSKGALIETDGTGVSVESQITWEKQSDGSYLVKVENGMEDTFTFDASADTLTRVYKDDSSDATYTLVEFVYLRKK